MSVAQSLKSPFRSWELGVEHHSDLTTFRHLNVAIAGTRFHLLLFIVLKISAASVCFCLLT